MDSSKNDKSIPDGYVQLPGSERSPAKEAKLLGPADAAETFNVTIVLRRRADGPPLPDFDYFANTPPGKRKRYEAGEFAEKFGAHPAEIDQVVKFAEKSGLKVVETHAARRTVVVSGTVTQMSKAFGVSLGRYEHTVTRHLGRERHPRTENYRGRDGFIHVPKELAELIMGVFGLDNRNISHRSSVDPPNTTTVGVQQVAQLYNFPTNSAAGQTIGIVSTSSQYGGYFQSDLQSYFGASLPTVTPISCIPGVSDALSNGSVEIVTTAATPAGGTVLTFASTAGIIVGSWPDPFSNPNPGLNVADYSTLYVSAVTPTTVTLSQPVINAIPSGTTIFFNPDGETTQDICISAAAAPGANVAVYLSDGGQDGWLTTINKAVFPGAGEPVCSVLSSSWYISGGDDTYGLARYGVTTGLLTVLTAAFQNAAILGETTICICSADFGTASDVGKYVQSTNPTVYAGDGKAHVIYPATDPWVLAVGGTTIGNIGKNGIPLAYDEYVWNDPDPSDITQWGTTGGGVSDFFDLPSYQANAGVPKSVNDNTHVGRGIPDVAGNASYNSGYGGLFLAGNDDIGNGTSASTPHWAGLIAVINAALGLRLGFINASIYKLGSSVFNDINPPSDGSGGPTNNSNNGIAGYTAGPGWDACTGWGSPNGVALLNAFQQVATVYISGGYQSPDIILTDLVTSTPVPVGGLPGGRWDTLLKPNTDYGFSANVHNDSGVNANNVEVRFWAIPGGVGTNGTMVGTPQTVSIPPYSYVNVQASAPFLSAGLGEHLCAVVSIYDPAGGCVVQAANALMIPDPGAGGAHGCSAWRNTDSMMTMSGSKFSFKLGLGELPLHLAEPILLKFHPVHVPVKWNQVAKVREIENMLKFVGAKSNVPLYLLPEINRDFHSMHLNTKLASIHGGKIEEREANQWHVFPEGREEKISFEVTGEIPEDAKIGDIVLMNVTAQYPKTRNRAARSIDFLEVIHITGEIKR